MTIYRLDINLEQWEKIKNEEIKVIFIKDLPTTYPVQIVYYVDENPKGSSICEKAETLDLTKQFVKQMHPQIARLLDSAKMSGYELYKYLQEGEDCKEAYAVPIKSLKIYED